MTQIRPLRPVYQKSAITRADEKPYLESFRDSPCESCGINDDTVVGAHFNLTHGSVGGKYRGAVAGLCHMCHAIVDRRVNVSAHVRETVIVKLLQKVLRDRFAGWKRERGE